MNEADRELAAYCGLYCGDCPYYRGRIADLARDLRKELRQTKFDRIANTWKAFANYRECYQMLGTMVGLRCRRACRGGGGPPFCKIRQCCQKKGIEGCWQCEEIESCGKLKFLEPVHQDAHIKNLIRIKKVGVDEWMKGKRLG